ncbi:TIGR02281 family clan AA aspartic protease [Mesorhizobium sp. SP-1A]|uniref:TIGR02281 family clan AA aspartic protease n=1 Tax=Mesorhizobium sp. SP-1A TaxID=3077840 RepID=UPI0028F71504|nr:TIGR02281 family clan AA aspartic protease [Mesorhizobium sp. SP-1A]
MLRNLVILVTFTLGAAFLAIIVQNNPQALESLLRPAAPASAPAEPTASAAAPAQPLGRKVLVQQDTQGHFQAVFKVNGRQVPAMIDTGATLVALNLSTARRAGMALSPGDFSREVNTANGRVRAALVRIASLEIGRIALNDVDAVVLDDKALDTNLIGMSFLKRLDKYQVENGALLLAQ